MDVWTFFFLEFAKRKSFIIMPVNVCIGISASKFAHFTGVLVNIHVKMLQTQIVIFILTCLSS